MSSAQIDGCKHKIKEILKKYIFEYPLFEIELVELIHDEFPKDVIRIACNQLNDEGYISLQTCLTIPVVHRFCDFSRHLLLYLPSGIIKA